MEPINMHTLNGIGTIVYGKRDVDIVNGSYITTKWFVIFFFPIIPLGSYRVIKEKQNFWTGGFARYQMTEAELNVSQILLTYFVWWFIPAVIAIWISKII